MQRNQQLALKKREESKSRINVNVDSTGLKQNSKTPIFQVLNALTNEYVVINELGSDNQILADAVIQLKRTRNTQINV